MEDLHVLTHACALAPGAVGETADHLVIAAWKIAKLHRDGARGAFAIEGNLTAPVELA